MSVYGSPSKAIFSFSAIAIFFLLGIIPVGLMVGKAFIVDEGISLANFRSLFFDSRQYNLFFRSMVIATGATITAMFMGVPMAFFIHRNRKNSARYVKHLYLLPLTIPPQVFTATGLSVLAMFGSPFSNSASLPMNELFTGIFMAIILLALAYHPLIVLTALTGLKAMDRRLEEAASLARGPMVVLGKITFGLITPYMITGAVFVFLFSLFNYGVPALLNIHTYPVEIFAQFSAFYDEGRATALGCPLIVIAIFMMGLMKKKMGSRAFFTINTGSRMHDHHTSAFVDKILFIWSWGIVTLSAIAPFGILGVKAASFQAISAVLRTSGREILGTLIFSGLAATLMVLISYPLADRINNDRTRFWRIMDFLTLTPFAVPATVLGIGMIYLWNRPLLEQVYGSAAIVVIAFTARFSPFAIQALSAGMGQVAPTLKDAAMLYEPSGLRRWYKIEWPLVKGTMAAGWLIGFILCMNELGATLLVIPPGHGTLSLKIFNLMHYGANQMVAGMSLLLVGTNLAVAAIVSKLFIMRNITGT